MLIWRRLKSLFRLRRTLRKQRSSLAMTLPTLQKLESLISGRNAARTATIVKDDALTEAVAAS
jgi:hypothetical protein